MLIIENGKTDNSDNKIIDLITDLLSMIIKPYGLNGQGNNSSNTGNNNADDTKKILKTIKELERKKSPNDIFRIIIGGFEEHFSDGDEREMEQRTAIWILMLLLYYYQPKQGNIYNMLNRIKSLWKKADDRETQLTEVVRKWGIDRSIVDEMYDAIKTYIDIEKYQNKLKWKIGAKYKHYRETFAKDRSDIDTGIKTLIELG